MTFGFKTFDANGVEIFSTSQRLVRVLHVERVLAGSPARNISIPGMRADRSWWISLSDTSYRRGPIATIVDGQLSVIGPLTAGTSAGLSSDGYIVVLGYG